MRGTSEAGQSAMEYALVIGLVSVMVAAVLAGAAPAWLSALVSSVNTALGLP